MTTTTSIINNQDYTDMQGAIKALRAAVLGSHFVKAMGYELLPHPSSVDKTSDTAIQRYYEYLCGAEFDEIAGQTLKSWLGRMKFNETDFTEFPDRISYLVENSDNDGTSLTGLIEQTASNVMQVGWHVLVAEYLNAPVAGENLSQSAAKARNIRAAIKSYNRESVIDWDFKRINGVLQLSYLKMVECRNELNVKSGAREDVTEYLVLALDDDGAYYWQKFDNDNLTQESAPMNYVTVGGKALKWLPVHIVSDSELQPGKMPKQLGMISPIATACLDRYRVSADYKETIKNICPTSYTAGWTDQGWDQFQTMNQGRDYIAFGARAMNNLPMGVTMDTLNPSITLEGFERYFDANKSKIMAYGGVWPSENGQSTKTATQSENESSEVTSRLVTLADNLENAFRRMCLYCLMFEGAISQDNIEDNLDMIEINLPSDFARSKLTSQEQKETRDNMLSGIYGRAEAVRILVRGGVTVSDVDTILAEDDGGSLTE